MNADRARRRRDLQPVRPGDEAAIELRLPAGRRCDPVEDRTRSVNRLRGTPLSMFPALERALDVNNTGPLVLLAGYGTPAAIRRTGTARLTKWPGNPHIGAIRPGAHRGRLQRVFCTSALVNVLWALIRARWCYHVTPPVTETA